MNIPSKVKNLFLKYTNDLSEIFSYWGEEIFDEKIEFKTKWFLSDNLETYLNTNNNLYGINDIIYEVGKNGFRLSSKITYDNNKKTIACFGCSNTFGIGLPWEDIWVSKLSEFLPEYNVRNYGFPGASNDMISRLIYNFTLKEEKPETICCFFPEINRREIVNEHDGLLINYLNSLLSNIEDVEDKNDKQEYMKTFLAYKVLSHEKNSFYNFLKNLKFIETLCKLHNINFYWTTWSLSLLSINHKFYNESFIKMDPSEVQNQDTARDHAHFGKELNLKLANLFYKKIVGKNK